MKKILSLLLTILMLFTYVSANESYGDWEKSGWFGDAATYHYSSKTGVLTIEGSGEATHHPDWETGKGLTDAEYAEYMSNSWRVREVIVGEGITSLDHDIFQQFRDLSKVTLPSTLKEIGSDAFYYCKSLTELTLPEGLEIIGGRAFRESSISRINIPEGVKKIGHDAFSHCPVTELHLPSTVEEIDYKAFSNNLHTLEKITVDENNQNFTSVDGVLFSKDMTKLIAFPSGKKNKAYTVPESVKVIGEYSFEYTTLSELNINEGTEIVEPGAISWSDTLEVVNFSDTVKEIRDMKENTNIKKLIIPESVTYYRGFNEEGRVDTVHRGDLPTPYYCYCGGFHHHSENFVWSDGWTWRQCQKLVDTPDSWAEDEIDKAKEAGIVPESLLYGFKSRITRREFAELVIALTEKAVGRELPLAEENFDDTHSVAVSKAKAAGIVSGRGDNIYNPGSFVTREEIAVMFLRTIEFVEKEKGVTLIEKKASIDKVYADRDKVSSWAVKALATLNGEGIIKGTTNSTLFPSGTATVQESVILALRIYEIVG
ncbi:MAG: leucine-rich repeat protein [Clostridia bacterium]|nr:leucine-rich repeat protein [Clostridia bacterium]